MSRSPLGMTTASQISAPAQAAVNTMPPTTMNASGTTSPSVAKTRPTGPNVVGVLRHLVGRPGATTVPTGAGHAGLESAGRTAA